MGWLFHHQPKMTHKYTSKESENIWVLSDCHFDHKNIIRYCHRPFITVEQMNDTLKMNWNNTVKDGDIVYYLGDLAYGRNARPNEWWLKQLKGNICFIRGSHDIGISRVHDREIRIADKMVVEVDGNFIMMVHNPLLEHEWDGWIVHGHVHNKQPYVDVKRKRINVSVEVVGYRPLRLFDIVEAIRESRFG